MDGIDVRKPKAFQHEPVHIEIDTADGGGVYRAHCCCGTRTKWSREPAAARDELRRHIAEAQSEQAAEITDDPWQRAKVLRMFAEFGDWGICPDRVRFAGKREIEVDVADRRAFDEWLLVLDPLAVSNGTSHQTVEWHGWQVHLYAPTAADLAAAILTPDAPLYDATVEDKPTDPQPTPADGNERAGV